MINHTALRFFLMEDVMERHGIHEGNDPLDIALFSVKLYSSSLKQHTLFLGTDYLFLGNYFGSRSLFSFTLSPQQTIDHIMFPQSFTLKEIIYCMDPCHQLFQHYGKATVA